VAHPALPKIDETREEWSLYVMSSARTTIAASVSRAALDSTRFQNEGTHDLYITDIALEETGGSLRSLEIEINDTVRKQDIFKNAASGATAAVVDPSGSTQNAVNGQFSAHFELKAAYRLPSKGTLQPYVTELDAAARTFRLTIVGYQRTPLSPPPA